MGWNVHHRWESSVLAAILALALVGSAIALTTGAVFAADTGAGPTGDPIIGGESPDRWIDHDDTGAENVRPGDELRMRIDVENTSKVVIDDVPISSGWEQTKISYYATSTGWSSNATTSYDSSSGEYTISLPVTTDGKVNVYFDVPADAEAGQYDFPVTVSNDATSTTDSTTLTSYIVTEEMMSVSIDAPETIAAGDSATIEVSGQYVSGLDADLPEDVNVTDVTASTATDVPFRVNEESLEFEVPNTHLARDVTVSITVEAPTDGLSIGEKSITVDGTQRTNTMASDTGNNKVVHKNATFEVVPDTTPSVSVTGGSVQAGENVTVTVTAQNTGVLSLDQIPTNWEIVDYENASGMPQILVTNGTQKIGWTWSANGDRNVTVTLKVPESASPGTTELAVTARDDYNQKATATGTVTVDGETSVVEEYDTNGEPGIQISELNDAMDAYFHNEMSISGLNEIIDAYFQQI